MLRPGTVQGTVDKLLHYICDSGSQNGDGAWNQVVLFVIGINSVVFLRYVGCQVELIQFLLLFQFPMDSPWPVRPQDDKTHVPLMFGSMLPFHIIATSCMCLRFYSKRVSKTRYFIDDYVLILSWVSGLLF